MPSWLMCIVGFVVVCSSSSQGLLDVRLGVPLMSAMRGLQNEVIVDKNDRGRALSQLHPPPTPRHDEPTLLAL